MTYWNAFVANLEMHGKGRFFDSRLNNASQFPKGWWGEEPPYHVPTFVLTHHPRQSVEMKGGTTFHFVTDGIHAALQKAKDAAKDKDVRIGGGIATIQQYLRARLIDELHLAFRPILMGSGENLFTGVDMAGLGYRCTEHVSTELAMHVVLKKDK